MSLDPAPFAAGSNRGPLVIEWGSISDEAGPFAIAITCIGDRILDGSEADCFYEVEKNVADLNPALFAIPAGSAAPEIAVAQRSFDDFRTSLSDALGNPTDGSVTPADDDPSSIITGDFSIEDAVPALAAAALFVGGLLLLWLLRRHRRAAFVRRIKRNTGKNRRQLGSWSQR
jgi:hypothetical protein